MEDYICDGCGETNPPIEVKGKTIHCQKCQVAVRPAKPGSRGETANIVVHGNWVYNADTGEPIKQL